jgi:hypothetical protein
MKKTQDNHLSDKSNDTIRRITNLCKISNNKKTKVDKTTQDKIKATNNNIDGDNKIINRKIVEPQINDSNPSLLLDSNFLLSVNDGDAEISLLSH